MFSSLLKNTVHMQPFLFKMATASSTSNRKFLTVEEVLQGLFADADSSDKTIESGSETEPSSSEEEDASDLAPLKTHRNNAHERVPKTRGGLSRANLHKKKVTEKEAEKETLENK